MSHRTVLVLGASGRLGAAAAHAFAAAGWQVVAQARSIPANQLPAGARALEDSLADPAGLARAAGPADVVVHAVNPPYPRWTAEALPLMRAGIEIATRLGARLMLPGNVYNYGTTIPAWVDERTPEHPDTRKGRIRVAMEREIAAACEHGLRATVLRAGDFFGGGSGTWLDLVIVKSLARGRLTYPGPLDRAHAWAYLPDLAHAFVALAQADRLPPFARYPFAGHTLTGTQLLDALERAARSIGVVPPARALRRGGVPWPLLRALGLVVPMLREVSEMAYLWRAPHALDGAALHSAVGPLPATPVDEALRATLVGLGYDASPRVAPT